MAMNKAGDVHVHGSADGPGTETEESGGHGPWGPDQDAEDGRGVPTPRPDATPRPAAAPMGEPAAATVALHFLHGVPAHHVSPSPHSGLPQSAGSVETTRPPSSGLPTAH